jgi:hypothetical protein
MDREYPCNADLQLAIVQKLGLRKIGNEAFMDDRTGQTYTLDQLSPNPTPRERGIVFEELRDAVINSRRRQD